MKEIKVLINSGGVFEGLFVSPELVNCDVELLDFCTDDPDELDDTEQRYQEIEKRVEDGELKFTC